MPILGSTGTFPLRGVVEFLAAHRRTGRLVVQVAEHTALVAFRNGRLLAAGIAAGSASPALGVASAAADIAATLAALEPLGDGYFAFHDGGIGGSANGYDVAEVMAALDGPPADTLPSGVPFADGTGWVRLADRPTFRPQRLDAADWNVLRAVGAGSTVDAVAARLGTTVPSLAPALGALHDRGLVLAGRATPRWAAPTAPVA